MKRNICLAGMSLLCFVLLCGCLGHTKQTVPAMSEETVKIDLFAKDYLNKSKTQIETLLGGLVEEEYYNGGLIYRFARADMWFWFGTDSVSFSQVPEDALCCFVMAPLSSAADFASYAVSEPELSETLGFSFGTHTFNEMDGIWNYAATEGGITCIVSCNENGVVSVKDDFITYITKR